MLKDGRLAKDPLNAQDPSSGPRGRVPGFPQAPEQNMLDLDDPDHKRLRASYPRRLRLV